MALISITGNITTPRPPALSGNIQNPHTPAETFKKSIKRDASLFASFKDGKF